jgi:hypothetical protein
MSPRREFHPHRPPPDGWVHRSPFHINDTYIESALPANQVFRTFTILSLNELARALHSIALCQVVCRLDRIESNRIESDWFGLGWVADEATSNDPVPRLIVAQIYLTY